MKPTAGSSQRMDERRLALWLEIASLLLMVSELIWGTAWYRILIFSQMLNSKVGPLAPSLLSTLLILGLVLFGSHGLARLAEHLKVNLAARRTAAVVWLVFCLFIPLKLLVYTHLDLNLGQLLARPFVAIASASWGFQEFWHLLIITLLVWRGFSLARSEAVRARILASFQLGLLMMLLYGMISLSMQANMQSLELLFAFLVSGILTMSFTRLTSVSESKGGKLPSLGVAWVLTIGISAVAVIGLGLLVGVTLGGQVGDLVALFMQILFGLALLLTFILLFPLWLLLLQITPRLGDFMGKFMTRIMSLGQAAQPAGGIQPAARSILAIAHYSRVVIMVGVVLIVILGTILAVVRIQRRRLALDLNRTDLPPQHANQPNPPKGGTRRRFNRPAQLLAAARIRRVYAELLRLGEQMHCPRPKASTPLEFLPKLQNLIPTQTAELEVITLAYDRIRYGELPESFEEVDGILKAWEQVSREGRKTLHALRAQRAQRRVNKESPRP